MLNLHVPKKIFFGEKFLSESIRPPEHVKAALRSIHLFSPLLKGDQFHAYLTAQAQNAVPRIFFFFLTY